MGVRGGVVGRGTLGSILGRVIGIFHWISPPRLSRPHCHGVDSAPNRTNWLTPWSRVLLEKLSGSQLVKKFPAVYATGRFITAFTSACHLSLSWVRSIQSTNPHPTSWRPILILSSNPRLSLPSGLFPHQNPVYTYTLPNTCYISRPSHCPFYHPNNIVWTVQIINLLIM